MLQTGEAARARLDGGSDGGGCDVVAVTAVAGAPASPSRTIPAAAGSSPMREAAVGVSVSSVVHNSNATHNSYFNNNSNNTTSSIVLL